MSGKSEKEAGSNIGRRDFLKTATAVGYSLCAASSTLFVLPLSGCDKKGMTKVAADGLPSHAALSDGLGFYNLIRESKASAPLYVTLDVTPAAAINKRVMAKSQEKQLNSEEILGLIDQMGQMRVLHLTFLGEQSFKNSDVLKYISHAEQNNISSAAASDGRDLNDDVLETLSKIPFFNLKFTLDGDTPETHDKFSGIGSFDTTVKAIGRAKKYGINVTVVTNATSENYDQVGRILDIARKLEADTYHVRRYIPVEAEKSTKGLALTPMQAESLLVLQSDEMARKEKSVTEIVGVDPMGGSRKLFVEAGVMSQRDNMYAWNVMCQSAATYMHITSTGMVTPCTWMPVSAGNVREDKLATIWENGGVFNVLRGRDSFDECVAHSFVETGNMLGTDPLKWG